MTARNTKLVSQKRDERLVGGPVNWGCLQSNSQDSVLHTRDLVP